MSFVNTWQNGTNDPYDNSNPEFWRLVSQTRYAILPPAEKATVEEIEDFITPSANFPVNNPSRFFIELPATVYRNTPTFWFAARNVTQAIELTVVDWNVTLSNYTCKVFSSTDSNNSKRRNILEIHVGASSTNIGDVIAIDGFFENYVFRAEDGNLINYRLKELENRSELIHLKRTSSQTLSLAASIYDIEFNAKIVDAYNEYNITTNRFTPQKPGKYTFNFYIEANSNDHIKLYLYKNGSYIEYWLNSASGASWGSGNTFVYIEYLKQSDIDVGDYYEFKVQGIIDSKTLNRAILQIERSEIKEYED